MFNPEYFNPIKSKHLVYYHGNGYIEGNLKVNDVATHRKIYLYVRKTQKLILHTTSNQDGNYRFDHIDPNIEYDIRAQDFNRNFQDAILTAVKPKTYP